MILLSALPQKREMLVSIVTQQHALTTIRLSHVCNAILAQYELENVHSGGKGKQQHANKLSAVKWKCGSQNFSNQESDGSQQKPEDRPKRQHSGCYDLLFHFLFLDDSADPCDCVLLLPDSFV
jgi:hypothetical protein